MRGNSVYFPDRVVPMLPERISNDLCSLREGEERALPRRAHGVRQARQQDAATPSCARMMRSAAKLSYQEAQAAIDGSPSDKAAPLLETRAASRCGPPTRRWPRRATGASRSTSTCPSARSCSTTQGRVERVDRARSGSTRTA